MTERTKAQKLAKEIRKSIVTMTGKANVSHSGSALSAADIVAVLYAEVLNVRPKEPLWAQRDRFILSKGHAATVLYSALALRGFFDKKTLDTFARDGSMLTCHPSLQNVPGVEAVTGSLGHGLGLGIGMALGLQHFKKTPQVYVLVSDGECDEGSIWEGILFAGNKKVNNLTLIIDYNKLQSYGRTADVQDLEPLANKLRAFKWEVLEVDGHDCHALKKAFDKPSAIKGRPRVIIAHTVKGKGVSFMEDKLEWHYRAPVGELLDEALRDIETPKS